ncbi:MAG: hypothetical protein K2X87_24470 [Gemmataceae bacterium]|nr:hypothetical protein [Gemmataceae bacterium]
MATLTEIGRRPAGVAAEGQFGPWFAGLAAHLLNATDFLVAGEPYRFAEVEAYYFGPDHPDPFTHKDPVQREFGRWYFHRTAGEYRGGSFKGVDLTFGDGRGTFGVLVRSVVAPDGTLIDGPSLTVDHLLRQTGTAGVAELDRVIAGRPWWDVSSPLAVRESGEPRSAEVVTTARVGLTLRRSRGRPDAPRFVMRPYRYLTEPRRVAKGRPQTVLALHVAGKDAAAIQAQTGVARRVTDKYVADFAVGECEPDFGPYIGKELSTAELCRLLGTWTAHFGAARPPS